MQEDPLPSPAEPASAARDASAEGVASAAAATLTTAPDTAAAPTVPELSPAACSVRLAELFPALFGVPTQQSPVKPIKLRIQVDIQQRAPGVFTKRALSMFLSRYTTGNAYLRALTLAPHRFDLDGQPAGEISVEHRQLAADELARRRDIHLARRAAEREAQRARELAMRQERAADEQARRDRAALLRAFETTTLTQANFCALKGLAVSALDALLARARQERAERPPEPRPAPQVLRPERGGRRDDRPVRPDHASHGGPRPRNGNSPKAQR